MTSISTPDIGGGASGLLPRIARELLQLQNNAMGASEAALLNLLPVAVYLCDAHGRITMHNDAAAEMWGRRPAPEDRWCGALTLLRADGSAFAGGESPIAAAINDPRASTSGDVIVVRPDGSRRFVVPHPRPLFDGQGRPNGALVMLLDVTERRASEQAAIAAAERLSFAMAASRMGDWTWDASTNMLRLTGRGAEIVGIPSGGEISRDAMRELLHPDDVEPTRRIVQAAMAARTDYSMEYRLRQPNGVYAWVAVKGRGVFNDRGELTSVVGVIQDIDDRKAAEARLQASEAQLRFISSNAPSFLAHLDREGRLLLVNKAFADRWKKTPSEMVGMKLADVVGATAWQMMEPYATRVLRGEKVDFEMEVEYRELGRRYVKGTCSPEFDAQGRVCGWLSAATDLTDRWRAEQAARESEARLRLAAKSGKLGIWDWDIVTNRVTWTDSLYDLHGVDRATFPATVTAFIELVHPDDRKPVERAIQSSLEHDVPYELEFRAVRPGGGLIWVFTNAVVVRQQGRAVRMLGATFDITARKQAELALRESELRFRALASNAPVGIFLTDINGDALFVNEMWRAMAGMTPEQARGKGWSKALHPDDRERVAAEWYAAVEARRPFNLEYRFQRPDGTITWLQGSAIEFRNTSGGLMGYLGTVVDLTRRKAAEDALRESEERFRTLASHAPVGIFLTDPEGETIFVNESWCAMAGLTSEDASGRGWARAMHPDDRARVAAEWAQALAENRSSSAEYRFVRADGGVTWVQGNAVQLRDKEGRLAGYIGTVADLTQRKEAEDRLRAREAQLRLITTNAPIILAHCDREQRYRFVNRAYTERFAREPERVIGRTVREVLGEEAHRALQPFMARALAGETLTFEIEVPYDHIGRRYMRAAYAPDVGEDGQVRGFFCAISDLTDRRQMEVALRQSEARFRQLADSMPQIVFGADAKGNSDYYNRRWYEMTGAKEGVTGDESFLPVLHPDDRQRCLETWYGSVATGAPYQIEYRFRFRERDEYRWHLGRALPVRDENGSIIRWYGTCTDIHDWKLVQEELRKAQGQLQAHANELELRVAERTASLREAIAQMEEFSYSVSHDLRAPLRAMNAYARALAEDYGAQLDDVARGYLERIQRSSTRMETLTHDVLTYSRVARAELEMKPLNLDVLLRDVLVQYRELQSPSAEVQICSPLLGVCGHESALGQCFANLLTNAAKFVAPGTTPRIRVRTEAQGERVRVWIEDNGIGIAPEHQNRLFRVFERMPTRHSYAGTGIGLAIVRKAVEKMGGTCGVVSDGRSGSNFWIELPRTTS